MAYTIFLNIWNTTPSRPATAAIHVRASDSQGSCGPDYQRTFSGRGLLNMNFRGIRATLGPPSHRLMLSHANGEEVIKCIDDRSASAGYQYFYKFCLENKFNSLKCCYYLALRGAGATIREYPGGYKVSDLKRKLTALKYTEF